MLNNVKQQEDVCNLSGGLVPLKWVNRSARAGSLGFTLVEILAVIAIIGILATIVMVSLNMARSKARDSRRISDVLQLQLALQMYYDSAGVYPEALPSLAPIYINAVPQDPVEGSYQYCTSLDHGTYHLGTRSEGLETSNAVLDIDADVMEGDCDEGGFSGADPVYDVRS